MDSNVREAPFDCTGHFSLTMVGPSGLEPPTPRLSSVCSNQLSYEPPFCAIQDYSRTSNSLLELVEPDGIEPTTS